MLPIPMCYIYGLCIDITHRDCVISMVCACACVNARASIRVVNSEASVGQRTSTSNYKLQEIHQGSTRDRWKSNIILCKAVDLT